MLHLNMGCLLWTASWLDVLAMCGSWVIALCTQCLSPQRLKLATLGLLKVTHCSCMSSMSRLHLGLALPLPRYTRQRGHGQEKFKLRFRFKMEMAIIQSEYVVHKGVNLTR